MTEIISDLVSTIIPVYNRPEMIRSAVESVLAQDYRPIEIIIVDDGSTDDTLSVCNDLVAVNPDEISVISQENQGPGAARELGRLSARGEYIQYLDSDDILLPTKFSDQVNALRKNPDCGIAYGKTRLTDFHGSTLADPYKWTGQQRKALFPGLLIDRWWCTHTPLYRRSVTDQIGPWSNLRFSQDWEYDARAAALNTMLITPGTHVSEHRTHDSVRQTGHGDWLQAKDQIKFFTTLYQCAVRAGVHYSTPEMQHFSRWVFAKARENGAAGETHSASQLFSLAVGCTSPAVANDMRIIGFLARTFGWRMTGVICRIKDKISGDHVGAHTRKQSWSE